MTLLARALVWGSPAPMRMWPMEPPGFRELKLLTPTNPQRVGGFDTAGRSLGVAVAGNYAYVADEFTGLQIIDISDAVNPQRVGGYDTSGRAYGIVVVGNYAYVADEAAGLQILDVS